jgi:hypothetical protein
MKLKEKRKRQGENDKRFSNLLIGHGLKLEHCIQIGVNVHLHSSRI